MEFLRKGPKLSNHAAVMVLLVVAYLASTGTAIIDYKLTQSAFSVALVLFLVALDFMTLVFLISRLVGRLDIVDAAWPLLFLVIEAMSLVLGDSHALTTMNVQRIVLILVALWALRLFVYIVRRLITKPEDRRYKAMRQKWTGNEALNAYFRVFVPQTILAGIISVSVVVLNVSPSLTFSLWTVAGIVVWLVGFCFETVSDLQLKRHLAKNPKTLMTSGLWRYTRHPNYFGEAAQWWGILVIVLDTPFGWMGIISPLTITYLLLFVSGVPLTEKAFKNRRGWKTYQKRTSAFLPLPPKKV